MLAQETSNSLINRLILCKQRSTSTCTQSAPFLLLILHSPNLDSQRQNKALTTTAQGKYTIQTQDDQQPLSNEYLVPSKNTPDITNLVGTPGSILVQRRSSKHWSDRGTGRRKMASTHSLSTLQVLPQRRNGSFLAQACQLSTREEVRVRSQSLQSSFNFVCITELKSFCTASEALRTSRDEKFSESLALPIESYCCPAAWQQ